VRTILAILEKAGGWRPSLYVRIENPPYLPLVIEAVDESGPLGLPALSIMYISEEHGEAKRHPEMQFELEPSRGNRVTLNPFYWRHDFIPAEQFSRFTTESEHILVGDVHARHIRFAAEWDATLSRQGTAEAFTEKSILG
jgi:hypothetical protein